MEKPTEVTDLAMIHNLSKDMAIAAAADIFNSIKGRAPQHLLDDPQTMEVVRITHEAGFLDGAEWLYGLMAQAAQDQKIMVALLRTGVAGSG